MTLVLQAQGAFETGARCARWRQPPFRECAESRFLRRPSKSPLVFTSRAPRTVLAPGRTAPSPLPRSHDSVQNLGSSADYQIPRESSQAVPPATVLAPGRTAPSPLPRSHLAFRRASKSPPRPVVGTGLESRVTQLTWLQSPSRLGGPAA